MSPLRLHVGVKSDPIEYRYTYRWLFRLMRECGVRHLQLGTFFELYHLPDEFFLRLREEAEAHGIRIAAVFTSHRELGGFFRDEIGWVDVARRNYERLIECAALVGAESAGTNPGSVPRDRMETKERGLRTFLRHMKELMAFARERGLRRLTLEPMSCLAEPPATADEIRSAMEELQAHYRSNPDTTAEVGLCADVSHGYADAQGRIVHPPLELLKVSLPWLAELHLKNTDARYEATFGFGPAERSRGVVDLRAVRELLLTNAHVLPVTELVGYLEIGGPKLGRDYSDPLLEEMLRSSLTYCREAFGGEGSEEPPAAERHGQVLLAPSLMCADALRLGEAVASLEKLGMDLLHVDLMDARFTPNMPLGLETVRAAAKGSRLPLDVHLMVMDNDFFVERAAEIGASWVSVHVESARHLDRTLGRIRALGMKAGAALNPATPLERLEYVLDRLDFVLIMTVNPGFAGQAIVPAALRKIGECRRWLDARGQAIPIQVDGNVSFENIPTMVALGADVLVLGTSSLFAAGSLSENAAKVREAVRDGLARRDRT